MCFNKEVSLVSFFSGIFFSYLIYQFNDVSYKIIGLFLGYISLMQLIEFLLWSHQICDNYNKLLSICALILNHSQPIILAILLLTFYKQSKENKQYIKGILIIYSIIIFFYSSQFFKPENLKCTIKGNNPHLLWNWNSMPYWEIVCSIFILSLGLLVYIGIPDKKLAYKVIIIGALMFISSAIIYPRNFIGVLWCFYSVFIPMILYFLHFLS
jgi:hypothetical protein